MEAGYAQNAAAAPETPMAQLKSEIERANARLNAVRITLQAIAARIHGEGPSAANERVADTIRSSGWLPSSREEISLTHSTIDQINILVEQLDGTI